MLTDREILDAYHKFGWEDDDAHMKGLREVAKAQYDKIMKKMRASDNLRLIQYSPKIEAYSSSSVSK